MNSLGHRVQSLWNPVITGWSDQRGGKIMIGLYSFGLQNCGSDDRLVVLTL